MEPKKKMGRPPKLNTETVAKVCQAIRLGLTFESAATFTGVSEQTFFSWKKQAEKGARGIYADFLEELKRAVVQGGAVLLKKIHDACSGGQTCTETRTVDLVTPNRN
jgi:hypothetical protein